MSEQKTVRLAYSSNRNISFNGTVDTGYSREQWNSLSEQQRMQAYDEAVWDIVELWELDDDAPDYG